MDINSKKNLGDKIQRFNFIFNETIELHKLIVRGKQFLLSKTNYNNVFDMEFYDSSYCDILKYQILFNSHYNIINLHKLLSDSSNDKNSLINIDNLLFNLKRCNEREEIRYLNNNIYTTYNDLIVKIREYRTQFFAHLDNKTFKEIHLTKNFYLDNLDEIRRLLDSISELLVRLIIYFFDEFKENDSSKKLSINNHILRMSTLKNEKKSYLNSNSEIFLDKLIDVFEDVSEIQSALKQSISDQDKIKLINEILVKSTGEVNGYKFFTYKY